MRQKPYINVSGVAVNSNYTNGFFKVNATQYTSHYKDNRALSILPVQAHFNPNKYKTKKPIPSNNTYVTIEGFLEDIETDASGHASLFHVSVDNINFLGRATLSPSIASSISEYIQFSAVRVGNKPLIIAPSTPSRTSRFKFNFEAVSPGSSFDTSAPSTPSATTRRHSETGASPRAGKRRK